MKLNKNKLKIMIIDYFIFLGLGLAEVVYSVEQLTTDH
jgi:hypothetical protein